MKSIRDKKEENKKKLSVSPLHPSWVDANDSDLRKEMMAHAIKMEEASFFNKYIESNTDSNKINEEVVPIGEVVTTGQDIFESKTDYEDFNTSFMWDTPKEKEQKINKVNINKDSPIGLNVKEDFSETTFGNVDFDDDLSWEPPQELKKQVVKEVEEREVVLTDLDRAIIKSILDKKYSKFPPPPGYNFKVALQREEKRFLEEKKEKVKNAQQAKQNYISNMVNLKYPQKNSYSSGKGLVEYSRSSSLSSAAVDGLHMSDTANTVLANMRGRKIENVTIGSDFELFLFDNNIKEVINAKPYIKGSKNFPYNFDKTSEFWCTSLDNILAEMNIPPVTNEKDFDAYVEKAINYVESNLPENIVTLAQPAMYIKEEFLNTEESKQFGCTPSYNAYTLSENPQPNGQETNLRTGAFHIHMKYDNMDFEVSAELIKILDLFLGIPSLIIEPANDRRKLYGTPGEFRFSKDKTTEYRVLSNYFSKNSKLRTWVFKNTMKGIEFFNNSGPLNTSVSRTVRSVISSSNIQQAEGLIDQYGILLP